MFLNVYRRFLLATASVEGKSAGGRFPASVSQAKAWAAASEVVKASSRRPDTLPRRVILLAREGIPPAMRGTLWPLLSGGSALQAASAGTSYARLVEASGASADPGAFLLLDGWNVLPHHPVLGALPGIRSARRVSLALAAARGMLHPPRPLVCVAAFLLAVMGLEREEQAFWTLAALAKHRLPARFFDADMSGAGVEACVLEGLLAEQCPTMWDRLAEDGDCEGAVPGLSADWIGSLFLRALPPDTAARVFDSLLCEGAKVLHRVALALCTLHATATFTCVGTRATRAVLDWRTRNCYDADTLMRAAFRSWPVGVSTIKLAVRRQNAALGARDAERNAAERLARLLNNGSTISGFLGDRQSVFNNSNVSPPQAALFSCSPAPDAKGVKKSSLWGWVSALTGKEDRGHMVVPLQGLLDEDTQSASNAEVSNCSPRGPLASGTSTEASLDGWEDPLPVGRPLSPGRRAQTAALRLLLSRPAVVAKAAIHTAVS